MKQAFAILVTASFVLPGTVSCGHRQPTFLEELISESESVPATAGPREIWQFRYRDSTVYYVPTSHLCCDTPSLLYDAEGHQICWPDGGFTGSGDGRCPDFASARTNGVRVWQRQERVQSE